MMNEWIEKKLLEIVYNIDLISVFIIYVLWNYIID